MAEPLTASGPIVVVGECMLEIVRAAAGVDWHLGHAGDTFNTALHLARLGEPVSFMTALGDDPFSAEMRAAWRAEGLDLRLVLTVPGRLPGLYAIRTDPSGERFFHYWRERAAVRAMFSLPEVEAALRSAGEAGLLHLSAITLSLFDDAGRRRLADVARGIRAAGGTVAFDTNYRAQLWPTPAAARAAIDAFALNVTIALPSADDEAALYGAGGPADVIARWQAAGVADVAVKLGAAGCALADGRVVPVADGVAVVDTAGAGDAFDAGYLLARRRGLTITEAAAAGNRLAGVVVAHPGAISPRGATPSAAALLGTTDDRR